jgi:hypothetical protein
MIRFISVTVALTVIGCADRRQPHDTGTEGGRAREVLNVAARERNPAAGSSPAAGEPQGTAMLAGTFSAESVTVPAALNPGQFRRKGKCLEVIVAGEVYTPILFSVPRDLRSGFLAGANRYEFGRRYRLAGGPVLATDLGISVSREVRQSCPRRYYAVAGIEPA